MNEVKQLQMRLTSDNKLVCDSNPTVIFCDGNIDYRCPVFILPTDDIEPNDSKSTNLYSEFKTYKAGDYCIYGDGLYKCIKDVNYGESFDENKWNMTTVPYEKENS